MYDDNIVRESSSRGVRKQVMKFNATLIAYQKHCSLTLATGGHARILLKLCITFGYSVSLSVVKVIKKHYILELDIFEMILYHYIL